MKFCNYESHEAADILPMMEADEYVELKEDIRRHGLLHPLVIHEGKILDGRNRAKACQELGISPRTVVWRESGVAPVSNGSALEWVLATNVTRRHLTPSQRAAIAIASLPLLETEAKERERMGKEKIPDPDEKGQARDKAAKIVGVNPRYVSDAKKIKEQSPATFEKLKAGTVTISQAKEVLAGGTQIPTQAQPEIAGDSPKLWALKMAWKHATKKDQRAFVDWMKTADKPQGRQKPIPT